MSKQHDENLNGNVNDTKLSMYKNIIKLLENPNRAKLSQAWRETKQIDKDIAYKEFNSLKGRATYLESLKRKAAEAKPRKKTFTVTFRALTIANDKLSGSLFSEKTGKKTARSIVLKGIRYTQVGKQFELEMLMDSQNLFIYVHLEIQITSYLLLSKEAK